MRKESYRRCTSHGSLSLIGEVEGKPRALKEIIKRNFMENNILKKLAFNQTE